MIQGYYYKNVVVQITQGTYKFPLSTNRSDLGLPQGAVVLGIFIRNYDDGAGTPAYSSLYKITLANKNVLPNAFITIKDKNTETLISQYPLAYLADNPFMFESQRKSDVDWNNSYIEIGTNVNAADIKKDEAFEFIVIYTLECGPEIETDWTFRIGEHFENANFKLLTIPLYANQIDYYFAPATNVGIPEDYLLIGLDLNTTPINYKASSVAANSSVYLTLQQGAMKFLDTIPYYLNFTGKPRPQFQRNFLPIVPTRVGDIDWQGSSFKFTDTAAPQNDTAISFGLIYVKK